MGSTGQQVDMHLPRARQVNSALFASMLISLGLLLGRLSGFLRESLLASRLGTSASADAAILILTLPDFMVGLLLSGGVSAALLPVLKQHNGTDRLYLTRRSGLVIALGFAVLALLFAVFAEGIIRLFIPRVDFSELTGFIVAFNMSLVALPVGALIGVSASYLNAVGRFTITGFSVLIFNGTICVYLALPFVNPRHLTVFAAVVVLATILRLLFQLSFMPETMRALRETPPSWPPRFLRKFVVGTLGFSVIVGASVVFRSLHASSGEGQMAVFNYALKLFELPAALLIAPVAIVFLQILSGLDHADNKSFEDIARKGMLAGFTMACVATSLGWLYMPLAVRIIFDHGAMTATDSGRITNIARTMFSALPFYALLQVGATALNAQGRPKTMMISSFFGLAVGVAFYYALASLGFRDTAAVAGFILFHLVAATLCIGFVFGWKVPRRTTLRSVIVMLFKLSLVFAPFAYLQMVASDAAVWMSVALVVSAFLLMIAVNFPLIEPLVSMKIDKS